jgi:hypothetical protein
MDDPDDEDVTDADAAAAVLDDEPLTADERTWREIQASRQLLTIPHG